MKINNSGLEIYRRSDGFAYTALVGGKGSGVEQVLRIVQLNCLKKKLVIIINKYKK